MEPTPPSKDMLLEACAGHVAAHHPVLIAASELATWHEARLSADAVSADDIDCVRAELVRDIDRWVMTAMPIPHAAATLHTETLGMVIDRLGQFSVAAYAALAQNLPECELHYAWKRLAELSVAYADLAAEIVARTRRLPDLTPLAPYGDSDGRGGGHVA